MIGTEILENTIKLHRYDKLVNNISMQLEQKRWLPGERLPSIRQLCKEYSLSKNTVIQALHILEAKKLIESRPKSGFFVSSFVNRPPPLKPDFDSVEPTPVNVPEILQDIMMRGAAFDILPNEPLPLPSSSLVTLQRHINNAMRYQASKKSMYYDEPIGNIHLRTQLKDHYRAAGLDKTADDFCITSGCQHSLFLALMVMCKPGDNIAVESPGFYGVLQLLQQLQLNVIEIPSSPVTGFDTDTLGSALDDWQIKACIVTPAYATPSGATMDLDAKQTLIKLANKYDFAVIEDDIYGDLGFTQRPTPLKALDTQERVVLCSSFSKSLSRDLRLGWIIGGRWQNQIVKLKLVNILANSQSTQLGLSTYMQEGHLKRHLQQKRQLLRSQRDQLVHTIHEFWPHDVRFSVPNGGLALWVEAAPTVDMQALYYAMLQQQIIITPGVLFTTNNSFKNCLRLSFNHPTTGNREKAIIKLARKLQTSV